MKKLIGSFLVLTSFIATARGAVITWTNLAGGSWQTAANWSPNQIPGAADSAQITTPGTYNITLAANVTVSNFTLGAASGAQTITVASHTLVASTLGTIAANGELILQGGGLEGNVTVSSGGKLTFSTTTQKSLYRTTLINNGTVRWSGGNIALGATPTTIITNAGVWEIFNNNSIFQGVGGPTAVFANTGTIQVSGEATFSNLQFNNSGAVDVQGGFLRFNGANNSIIGGTFNAAIGAQVNLASGSFTENGGVFTGAGSSRFSGGTLRLVNDRLNGLSLEGGEVDPGPAFQNAGAITNLTINGATLIGTNEISGEVVFTAGGIEGFTTVRTGGSLYLSGPAQMTLYRTTLINNGIVHTGLGNLALGATPTTLITNAGYWDIGADNSIFQGVGGPTPIFHNSGKLVKFAGTVTATFSNIRFINTGIVQTDVGTLQFTGSVGSILGGTFSAPYPDGRFVLASGTYTESGASFTGPGIQRMTGGTLTLLNDIMPGLLLSGGDVVLASNFQGGSITNLTLDGSLLTGVNAVAGTMTILSGGLEGSLTIAPTGTLVFSSATQKTLYRSTLVNYGTMRWQGGNLSLGATPTTLITNAGAWEITGNDNIFQGIGGPDPVIVNDTSGTIRKLTATGVTTFSNVKFENRGTFEALNGSVQFNGSQNSILGGAFNTEPGAAINFASGTLIENGAVFTGAGSSRMTGGTLTLIKDQINGLSLAGGDVDIGPAFQDAGAITNLTISGATLIGVNQVSKGTLTVTAGGIEGTTTILPAGNLVFSGATQKTLYRTTLLNHGSVTWSGGSLSLGATPTTLITNTGLWEITGDDTMFQGIGGPTPVFANLGSLRKIAGSGVTTLSNLKFANAGSVEVRAGTIQHSGAVTSTLGGTIDTTAGAAFTLASGSYTESGGSFTGPGTSRMTGGTLTLVNDILDGLALNNGDVKISSTFQSNGAITNLTLDGATLIGTNQVAGTLAIRAGGTEGELTILPAGTLLLDTSAQKAFYRTTLHNNGAVKWLAGNLSFGATPTTIINNSGLWEIAGDDSMFQGIGGPTPQFNNAPSGHVKKIAGSGVTSINNVTFASTGTVEAQSGTFRFPNNYTHNTGTLRLSGGRIDASGLLTFASGTLEGSGVFGNSIFNGGSISPGVNGPGKITFPSGLKLTAAATVSIDGQNSTPGSGHDQLAVTGAVDLAGANLQVTSMSPMLVGARMNIIENDATDVVTGTFSSKPEGYLFQTGAQLFRIRYSSGAGNDVALIRDDGGVRLTAIRYQSDGSFLLRGLGTNSGIYRISATTNVQSWIDLGETTANGGGLFEFTDTNAHQFPARFYQSFGPGIEVE